MEPLPLCPQCDSPLRPWRWCLRIRRRASGETESLNVPILRCDACGRSHRCLPDCLVPHKHFDVESIEAGLQEGMAAAVAADETTIRRWHRWFELFSGYAEGILVALHTRGVVAEPVDRSRPLPTILHRLGPYVGDAANWLARVIRPMLHAGYWQCFPG
jgi:hypothetical protein